VPNNTLSELVTLADAERHINILHL